MVTDLKAGAFHVEAKLHAFRKTQDGVVVSFVVSPIDMPDRLALDPLGTRYMLALAEIGDDERPVAPKNAARSIASLAAYAAKDDMERAVTRAALLAKDEMFRDWLSIMRWPAEDENDCASYIRNYCGVGSRNELASNGDAYERFLRMETSFRLWRDGIEVR